MKVHIEGDLYIEGDDQNIEVREYTGKKDAKSGKDLFNNHGYYANVQQAVKKVLRMKIADSQAPTLKELIIDINRIEREIDKLIKG